MSSASTAADVSAWVPSSYRLGAVVHSSASTLVYRARRARDGKDVIVKVCRDEAPSREALARLEREYFILQKLGLPVVPRPLALERVNASLALVVEDSGAEPADAVAQRPGFGTREWLELAIAIARAVEAVHARRVIHKDLKPQHMLVSATGAVTLIDFGISSELAAEHCQLAAPDALEGTLAYMAPEQTGRMNRPVDRRSDLYALGVSLYQLATDRLPFTSRDPLELVHCHIARLAPRADSVKSGLPAAVGSIIEKLMAKAAEDRYQSASGLLADLTRCLEALGTTGRIDPFELGQADLSEVLQLPKRLYGRADALAVMEATFEAAKAGVPQLLLVRGPSGIGKSALVQELRRRLALRGHFAAGKFDLLGRGEPYSALAAACRELVRSMLCVPAAVLEGRRRALLQALGPNAQLVCELVPELELVIGAHPAPPPLDPAEAQNRFELTLLGFLEGILAPDEPLVLFLDDLQWADPPSLRLLRRALTEVHRPLLALGAYRDSEVSGLHPLLLALEELAKSGAATHQLSLGPLRLDHVAQLVADTLHRPVPEVQPLAAVLFEKTQGNPFHLGQFLEALAREGLVRPDLARHQWVWSLDAIEAREVAANVVDMVLHRLRSLGAEAQRVLSLGACIGHAFDSRTMTLVAELDRAELSRGLTSALREGLLVPLDQQYRYLELPEAEAPEVLNARFRFVHDRVQQAAYGLIDPSRRQEVHLRIGRLLKGALGDAPAFDGAGSGGKSSAEPLFFVAQQMNRGAELIRDQAERDWLAELNLAIARRALATAATALALEHATQTVTLLGEAGWTRRPSIAAAARIAQAEAQYVAGRLDEALAILDEVAARATGVLDRVAAGHLRTDVLTRRGQLLEACQASSATMALLGADLPEPEDMVRLGEAIYLERDAVQRLMAGRDLASLTELPEMTDPVKLAELRALAGAFPAANRGYSELMVLLVLKGTRLMLEHGATDLVSFFFEQYAVAQAAMTGDHAAAFHTGRLALDLGLARKNVAAVGPAHFLFAAFVSHWCEPLARSLEHFELATRRCLELGDDLHAASAVTLGLLYRLHAGHSLEAVRAALPAAVEAIERMGDVLDRQLLALVERTVACLSGEAGSPGCLAGGDFDPAALEAVAPRGTLSWLHAAQAVVSFHSGGWSECLAAAATSDPTMGTVAGVDLRWYPALAHAALARQSEGPARDQHLKHLARAAEQFARWAQLAPANHRHRQALLAAELADLGGDAGLAADGYDQAISAAKAEGFVHQQALACELCADFYLRRGRERVARAYLGDAVAAYRSWGAQRKAEALTRRRAALESPTPGGGEEGRGPELGLASGLSRPSSSSVGRASATLDFESAVRAAQAIAGELKADRLLDRLLRILVENAGAQRGVLVTPGDGGLEVVAERTVEPDAVRLLHDVRLGGEGAWAPEQVVRYVARTGETVVMGEGGEEGALFAEDPYLGSLRPKSVLCVALMHQGQLAAVVYLENRATPQVFSPARVGRIQLLAGHAASALANSRLYEEVQAARVELEKRVEERTRELSRRNGELKEVFDAVTQGLLTIDRRGEVAGEVSAVASTWFGPVAQGARLDEVLARVDPSYARAFTAAFARLGGDDATLSQALAAVPRRLTVGARKLELELRRVGEEARWNRLLVVVSDVTDQERQKALEVELRHAQKLQSVGQLAAGIAHEINTPAQFVGDSLTFLEQGFADLSQVLEAYQRGLSAVAQGTSPTEVQAAVAQAEEAADLAFVKENVPSTLARARDGVARISTLVSAMKEFAHPAFKEKAPEDLNRALRNTLAIARNEYKEVADVEAELGKLPLVLCHLSDLNQVFLNLLVNAAQAIAEVTAARGGRGRIRVRTRHEGERVRITIADTPEAIRDRVFEPFFTTKVVGKGSGQGLAIARSIVVDRHGGAITFESVVGEGTTFSVVLPVG